MLCVTLRKDKAKKVSYFFCFFARAKVGQVMCYRCCGTSVYLFHDFFLFITTIYLSRFLAKDFRPPLPKVAKNANATLFGLYLATRAAGDRCHYGVRGV